MKHLHLSETADRADDNMSTVLELVLEHIFRDDLIKDRHTLLTGRLVCRAWRNCGAFSTKITAVTLHTLADVDLASKILTRKPCVHLPWRTVEESRAFPNVNMLTVSKGLQWELQECSESKELLASIEKVDVHMSFRASNEEEVESFHTLAKIASSVELTCFRLSHYVLDYFFDNVAALDRLTKLTLNGNFVENPESLISLAGSSSLRHLALDGQPITTEAELTEFLSICNTLTQLTRLDIAACSRWFFQGDLESLCRVINNAAPKALNEYETLLLPEPNAEPRGCRLRASWTKGVVKVDHCKCWITIFKDAPPDLERKVRRELSKGPRYCAILQQLNIKFYDKVPRSDFRIDLTAVASVPELKLVVKVRRYVSTTDGLLQLQVGADGPSQPGICQRTDENSAVPACGMPVLTAQPGVQMAASKLTIEARVLSAMEFTHLVDLGLGLPALFPHLQHLSLCHYLSGLVQPTYISQLTRLTHLTLGVESRDKTREEAHKPYPPFSPPAFPPSLRELVLCSDDLDLPSQVILEHLTKLSLRRRRRQGTCTLDALQSWRSPVRELRLSGFQSCLNLPALASAFPHLEKMELELGSFDVSALSSLRSLRELVLDLPESDTAVLKGADMLTTLSVLHVFNASDNLNGLDKLENLKYLRHLEYSIHLCHPFFVKWEFKRSTPTYDEVRARGQSLLWKLGGSMFHTTVKLDVKGFGEDPPVYTTNDDV